MKALALHCIVAAVCVFLSPAETSAQDKPNVLFLAVDDMKDWVNCLGGYKGTAPSATG